MAQMKKYIDQLGRELLLEETPEQIISLVPSQTSLLYHLGIQPIAQTIFCIHPEKAFKSANKIGGTKKLRIDKIKQLKPDLIIGNKEENEKSQIEQLAKEFPIWMSDINTKEDAMSMIRSLGKLLNREKEAEKLTREINEAFKTIMSMPKVRAIYLIWQDPFMAVGHPTYIDHMLYCMGIENAAKGLGRYPQLITEQIQDLKPELILLSSEPFPFKEKHLQRIKREFPFAKLLLVDGELFSWYGDKMREFPAYANQLITQLE